MHRRLLGCRLFSAERISRLKTVNHFQTLQVPATFRQSSDALQSALHNAQRRWHPDRHAGSALDERELAARRSAEANAAYSVLTSPQKRAAHLLEVKGGDAIGEEGGMEDSPEFLMWVMETREQIDGAEIAELRRILEECQSLVGECIMSLEAAFDDDEDIAVARTETVRLRYLQRIGDAVEAKLSSRE